MMNCGRIPLFPGDHNRDSCVRMALFGDHHSEDWRGMQDERCQTVRVYNPACSGEYADVQLCVDCCGNLSICVRRPGDKCCSRNKRHTSRCGCQSKGYYS